MKVLITKCVQVSWEIEVPDCDPNDPTEEARQAALDEAAGAEPVWEGVPDGASGDCVSITAGPPEGAAEGWDEWELFE